MSGMWFNRFPAPYLEGYEKRTGEGYEGIWAPGPIWESARCCSTLSEIFFESGTDQIRPLKVRLTLEDKTFDPPSFGKDARLEEVRFYGGEQADFEWKEGEDETKRLNLVLFGDDGADYSYVRGTLARKLNYALEIQIKKKKTATANLSFKLSGDGVARMLELMQDGLEAPPASVSGS